MEQWTKIRLMVEHEGLSIREVQRRTGLHYKTIKRILANPEPPPFDCPERAKPKIGPFLERIADIVTEDAPRKKKQRHTAKPCSTDCGRSQPSNSRTRPPSSGGASNSKTWTNCHRPHAPSSTVTESRTMPSKPSKYLVVNYGIFEKDNNQEPLDAWKQRRISFRDAQNVTLNCSCPVSAR